MKTPNRTNPARVRAHVTVVAIALAIAAKPQKIKLSQPVGNPLHGHGGFHDELNIGCIELFLQ